MFTGEKLSENKIILYNDQFDLVQDFWQIIFFKPEMNITKILDPIVYCTTKWYSFTFDEVLEINEDLPNALIHLEDGEWIITIQTSDDLITWTDVYKDLYYQIITQTLQTTIY